MGRSRKFFWVILFPCFFVILSNPLKAKSSAQTSSTNNSAASDPKGAAILTNSLQTMGLNSLGSVTSTQTAVSVTDDHGQTATATITTQGPNHIRFENPGYVIVTDGVSAGMSDGSNAAIQVSPLALGEIGITHIPILSIFSNWAQAGVTLGYLGEESLNGSNVHHLTYSLPIDAEFGAGSAPRTCDIFIDTQTLLITRITYLIRAPLDLKSVQVMTVDYGNYASMSGILVPLTATYSNNGHVVVKQVISSFTVNVATSDASFQLQ